MQPDKICILLDHITYSRDESGETYTKKLLTATRVFKNNTYVASYTYYGCFIADGCVTKPVVKPLPDPEQVFRTLRESYVAQQKKADVSYYNWLSNKTK